MQDKCTLGRVDVFLKELVKWYDSLHRDGLLDCNMSVRRRECTKQDDLPLELVKVTARRFPKAESAMQTFKPREEPNAWIYRQSVSWGVVPLVRTLGANRIAIPRSVSLSVIVA